MEDSRIIDLYWARSQDAITETKTRYGRLIYSIAMKILRIHEDADECENDTYMKAWNSMPPQRPNILSAFLGKIARNLALDRYEREHAQKRGGSQIPLILDELEECIPTVISIEQLYEEKELEAAIDTFISTLPQTDRRMFIARYWFLESVAEISKRLGYSQSKVKSSLYRSRGKLRAYLQEEGLC
jgi:RNA polymerase sigma-70 factor (ECF subfamily)